MVEVADIFARYGGEYLDKFGDSMVPGHRRAMEELVACRTEPMGGHVYICDRCGEKHYAYHSCRNRHCPKCHRDDTARWLDQRRTELLPVPYFHVTFTLPHCLHDVARSRQRVVYGILMRAAAHSLMKLTADPRYVGGTVGVLAVLHTWGRTLVYHPHVHCLVPAGGVADAHWVAARRAYLIPVRALSTIFRAKFRDLLHSELPDVELPGRVWRRKWVVYAKPALHGTEKVLEYLGRYVHRVAITNNRILAIDDGTVTFRYKDSRDGRWKTMTLPAGEFIRRFLQHVLPKGFHKVRYYGLWSPSNRGVLRQVQLVLAHDEPPAPTQSAPPCDEHTLFDTGPAGRRCPHCGKGTLVWLAAIPRQPRQPP
jgi:hypothetical protein